MMGDAILVTGGAGFIGSNFILQWMERETTPVVNLDKLTYAGNLRNLERVSADPRYTFVHGDIADRKTREKVGIEPRDVVLVFVRDDQKIDMQPATGIGLHFAFDRRPQDLGLLRTAVDDQMMLGSSRSVADPEAIPLSGGDHVNSQHPRPR